MTETKSGDQCEAKLNDFYQWNWDFNTTSPDTHSDIKFVRLIAEWKVNDLEDKELK